MFDPNDISSLDLSEALKLAELVKAQVAASTETQKDQIRSMVQELSDVTNIPVQVLLAQLFPVQPLPPKYRDLANPQNVWSGRGKKPAWLQAALDGGADLSQFEVPVTA